MYEDDSVLCVEVCLHCAKCVKNCVECVKKCNVL